MQNSSLLCHAEAGVVPKRGRLTQVELEWNQTKKVLHLKEKKRKKKKVYLYDLSTHLTANLAKYGRKQVRTDSSLFLISLFFFFFFK